MFCFFINKIDSAPYQIISNTGSHLIEYKILEVFLNFTLWTNIRENEGNLSLPLLSQLKMKILE